MLLALLLILVGAQVREVTERSFWASLHHTARARFMQATAERNQRDTEVKREAADARTEAVQSVMRYVCHELRNPLHGIMVSSGTLCMWVWLWLITWLAALYCGRVCWRVYEARCLSWMRWSHGCRRMWTPSPTPPAPCPSS